MAAVDWAIIILYAGSMLALALWVGRKQETREDYYLGGRSVPSWQVTASMLATQISAVSLVGGPAFIAMKPGGGLVWLQYELAVPLAMAAVLALLLPAFHAARVVTIYEFLELRFGPTARASISAVFLASRGLATGVVVWTSALVIAHPMGWSVGWTAAAMALVSLAYTAVGGIKADILTDIVQLVVLWIGTIICIACIGEVSLEGVDPARLRILDAGSTGLGDGATFGLLPMLAGGFFLYVSYYGCDQSQAQRLMTTADIGGARKALLWNGLLRFPLALTYCAFGLLLAGFLARRPDFAALVTEPNNLVPAFLTHHVPAGARGLIVAGLLAASMSSLDSAYNSLSAATQEDFLRRYSARFRAISGRAELFWSRGITLAWGAVTTGLAFLTPMLAPTVIEAVNKVGSLFYGPVLGVFLLGTMSKRATEGGAVAGLVAGVTVNLVLWLGVGEKVSWLWWNAAGFAACAAVGWAVRAGRPRALPEATAAGSRRLVAILVAAFAGMVALSFLLEGLLGAT